MEAPELTVSTENLFPQQMIDCLTSSRELGGGELRVTELTIEGDPFTTYYRTFMNSDMVDIFIDYSRDRYGGGWRQTTCRVPIISARSLLACTFNV